MVIGYWRDLYLLPKGNAMFDQLDKRTRLILLAITMTALCLAVNRLGHQPLWVDEAVTWFWTKHSIRGIVEGVQHSSETHGAFYFSVMKVWFAFGDSEFWLRSFSALCFTFTVPVVYVIGQTMSGRRAGLYAACLAATAPFLIRYAQEARMYAILTFFCSLALMSAALIISRQADRPPAVIGQRLRGRRAGLYAACLAAAAPFLIRYAQEIPYAILTFFCSLALMSAVLIISRQADRPPAVIGQGLRGRWRRWRRGAFDCMGEDDLLWATYIVAVLGGMYSHHTALLLPVVTTLIFLVAIAAAPSYRWRRLRNLIAASMVALALYLPNISMLSASVENLERGGSPAPVDFGWFQKTLFIVYGSGEYLREQTIALAALCVLALWGWRRRKDWKWVGFALIGTLGLPLMLAAASSLFRPVFGARTIIWSSIPFYVACGVGLARLPSAGLRRIVLAGLLLCNLYGVWKQYERAIPEPWDSVAQTVAQAASSDSALLLCPGWGRTPFSYYWRRHDHDMAIFGELDKQMAALFLEPAAGDVKKWTRQGDPRAMASLFDDYSELWIATRRGNAPQYAYCGLPALQDVFSGRGRLVAERDFGESLKLLTFARDDAPAAPD